MKDLSVIKFKYYQRTEISISLNIILYMSSQTRVLTGCSAEEMINYSAKHHIVAPNGDAQLYRISIFLSRQRVGFFVWC